MYRFLKWPFVLKSAQDKFQRKTDCCYAGLRDVVAIVDDVLVCGKTGTEHDNNLKLLYSVQEIWGSSSKMKSLT